jgi:hypothetical protein
MTQRASCEFNVSTYLSGQPFVVAARSKGDLPILERALLSFDVPPGTTVDEAREIARYLTEHVTHVCLTEWEEGRLVSKLN